MIIYYTTNRIDERIASLVREQIKKSGLPIISCSLEPLDFGDNHVYKGEPGAVTMVSQILYALSFTKSNYVFFCEHDVIYHPSHFEFKPKEKDIFYYNTNVWKWDYDSKRVITFDHMRSLSGLCVNRETALQHFSKRMDWIIHNKYHKLPITRNPTWARKYGYEPSEKNGEKTEEWKSKEPNIDIRHGKTITPRKMNYEDFIHKPTGWQESTIDQFWCKDLVC